MRIWNCLCIAVAGIALLSAQSLSASPLSAQDATERVRSWNSRRSERAGRPGPGPSGKVRTLAEDGTNLFHLVALEGGGFVAVAADDSRSPVMAFSPTGDLPDPSDGGPLWALLGADGAASAGLPNPRRHGDRRKMRATESTFARVRPRTAAASTVVKASPSSLTSVSDVRVPPLVQSKWDQKMAGGGYCYNYHTPCHWYCGCVATAMAQLMRYHKYPTASVRVQTFTCHSNETAVALSMIGGIYDWDLMPLEPGFSSSNAELEMVGRICYDAGVAMRMQYTAGGSAAFGGFEHDPLKKVFRYANAESYITTDTLGDDVIKNAILANLDAGFPVLLGIVAPNSSGQDEGHSIVADGYGYEDETLWCHLNFGWSGSCNLWYALPNIPASGYSFSIVSSVVYNVFPKGTGQLVTGRVTDEDGNALSNATVTASYRLGWSTTKVTTNVTTSATGIYAFRLPVSSFDGQRTFELSAKYGAGATKSSITATASSSSSPSVDFENRSYSYSKLSVGNSWGNNLVIVAAAGTDAAISEFGAAKDTGGIDGLCLSFTGTAGAKYIVEWKDSLTNSTWNVWTNALLGTEGELSVFLPFDATEAQSRFYRVRSAR